MSKPGKGTLLDL